MEIKDRQIRFWQILAGVTLIYLILGVTLTFIPSYIKGVTTHGISGYILGGVLTIWFVIAPIAYLKWIKPSQQSLQLKTTTSEEISAKAKQRPTAPKSLNIRYRVNIVYLAFFFIVLLFQFLIFVLRGGDNIFIEYWFTFIMLVMGLYNLATIIQLAQMRDELNLVEMSKMRKRLNHWWYLVLGLAAIWFIVVWIIFPGLEIESIHQLAGMLTSIWLVIISFFYLLYVRRYPLRN